jgi:hypothetical protein
VARRNPARPASSIIAAANGAGAAGLAVGSRAVPASHGRIPQLADQPIATKRKLQLTPIGAPPAVLSSKPVNTSRMEPNRCPRMLAGQDRKMPGNI